MSKKKSTLFAKEDFPAYCDFNCRFAAFATPETTGACRKELSVWCINFNRFNYKNNNCLAVRKKQK